MIIEEKNENYHLFIGSNEKSLSKLINFQKSSLNQEVLKNKVDPRLSANFYQIKQEINAQTRDELKQEESIENKTYSNDKGMETDSNHFSQDFISFDNNRDHEDRKIQSSKKIRKIPREPFDFKNNKRYLENKTTILYQNMKNDKNVINANNKNTGDYINKQNHYNKNNEPKKSRQEYFKDMDDKFFENFEERLSSECKKLPIIDNYKEILYSSFIEDDINNQVTVISGDTGCGKSTQVPKYIFLASEMRGRKVKIICTQPRRMAALNLSKRVSLELGKVMK
jgi:hypothetical protein